MATDIYGMLTGGYDPRAAQMKQQQAFQQQLGTATDPRAFIAAVGSNMGNQIGQAAQGMFGNSEQKSVEDVLQQVSSVTDPLEQAKAAYSLFSQKNMPKQAQMMLERVRALEQEGVNTKYKQAQTDYYSNRATSGGKGTGAERMLAKIGDVRRRMLQGEEVPAWEVAEANDMIQQLGKQKTYEQDGQLITISQSQISPLPVKGATPAQGEAAGAPAAPGVVVGGPMVTNTPQYTERQKKLTDSREKAIGDFKIGLNRIDEIMSNTDFTRGIIGGLAALNPSSEAASQRRALQTIVAKTVTETLSTLKEQSKTGATGFGALSAPELEIIQSAITSLDPMDPRFDARLLELRNRWEAAIKKMEEAQMANSMGGEVLPAASAVKERPPLSSFKR
jgi:hypothetical protein